MPNYFCEKANIRVLGIALSGFSAFLNLYATQSLLPLFSEVFHTSKLKVSLTVSATMIGVSLAAPLVGIVADIVGRKYVICLAIFSLSIPTFLIATAGDLNTLILWRFTQGLFIAIIFSVTIAYISEEWANVGVGSAMSAYITGNIFGGVLGRFLSGAIADYFNWRFAFIILGCLNLVCVFAVVICLPRSRNFVRQQDLITSMIALGKHLRNPNLLAACAVGFNVLFSNVSTFTYVNFYLAAAPFCLETTALGSIFFVYLLGAVITPVVGKWLDSIGYRLVLAIAITTASVGVLLTLVSKLWLVIIGLAISSSGVFVCQSAVKSYVGVVAKEGKSSASGLYVCCFYIGGSVGAILPAFFWSLGGWPACVALIVIVQLLTGSIALVYWR